MDASFLPLVGGPSACFPLIKVLMPLACATETAVRSRSTKSLATIVAAIPGTASAGADATNFASTEEWAALKAFILELSVGSEAAEAEAAGKKVEEPWFPAKLSASNLYPAVYACLPKDGMAEEKGALLENFAALSDDEMPMVRANAAGALAGLSTLVTTATFKQHLLPIFKLVSEDR